MNRDSALWPALPHGALLIVLGSSALVQGQPAEEYHMDGTRSGSGVADKEQAEASDRMSLQTSAESLRALKFRAAVGVGIGTLSFERPIVGGQQRLPDTAFALAELLLRARAWPNSAVSLEVSLHYQSSLGLALQLAPQFALPENVQLRAQRLEVSVAPILRLGPGSHAPLLVLSLSFLVRSLTPQVHQFALPNYVLAGPQLRTELSIQLGSWIHLRAGPEAAWLAIVDSALQRAGACCQGAAIGGRGAIEADVGPTLRVALSYAQSHAFVPLSGWRFRDVERVATARIAGEL